MLSAIHDVVVVVEIINHCYNTSCNRDSSQYTSRLFETLQISTFHHCFTTLHLNNIFSLMIPGFGWKRLLDV